MVTRDNQATRPQQVRHVFFKTPAAVTDVQLLVLILGTGTTRHGRGQEKKTWTAVELATDLIKGAGGRLEHLVASVRRPNFDLHRFGLGKKLGSRLIAAMELAHRWRRNPRRWRGGRVRHDVDLVRQVLERESRLTEGELLAIVSSRYPRGQKEFGAALKAFGGPQRLIELLISKVLGSDGNREAALYAVFSGFDTYADGRCRLLAVAELARRHRSRAPAECLVLKPGTLGLRSRYLFKLLDPDSPLEPDRRVSLLEQARSNPRMSADFAILDRLAKEALTDSHEHAIRLHFQFAALLNRRGWAHPAEVLGEPLPFAALMSIAEATLARHGGTAARLVEVKELLEAAEQAAASGPVTAFLKELGETGISESGVRKALEEAKRKLARDHRRAGSATTSKVKQGRAHGSSRDNRNATAEDEEPIGLN